LNVYGVSLAPDRGVLTPGTVFLLGRHLTNLVTLGRNQ
jgi:hypothetical protein